MNDKGKNKNSAYLFVYWLTKTSNIEQGIKNDEVAKARTPKLSKPLNRLNHKLKPGTSYHIF